MGEWRGEERYSVAEGGRRRVGRDWRKESKRMKGVRGSMRGNEKRRETMGRKGRREKASRALESENKRTTQEGREGERDTW